MTSFDANTPPVVRPWRSYYLGQQLIYVEHNDLHYVFEGHWEDYLRLRKRVPARVRVYDRLVELKYDLFSQGVLA